MSLVEIARYLRMGREVPGGALAERVTQLSGEVLAAMCPQRVWLRLPMPFHPESRKLAEHLAGCVAVYLICGTLGPGVDALQRRVAVNSGADAFIVQAIGAAAIEKWMDEVEDEIRHELNPGEVLLRRYSPGYGDFPLAVQREMLEMLDASRKVGVALTDTLLMVPSKSVSAVIGVSIE